MEIKGWHICNADNKIQSEQSKGQQGNSDIMNDEIQSETKITCI